MIRHRWLVLVVVLCVVSVTTHARAADSSGPAMTEAAKRFLASLDEKAKAVATMPFDDPRRMDWHHVPKPQRKGLQYRDMTEPQRQLCHALLKTGFSPSGYAKACTIMSMENNVKEGERIHGTKLTHLRDPLRYFLTIFGEPSDATWGWSFEGHHLSLNYVIRGGTIAADAPNAWGANPATIHDFVQGGPPVGTRTLADEEQPAFDLVAALDDAQRAKAIVSPKPPGEYRDPGKPRPPSAPPVGCPAAEMNEAQRGKLMSLIEAYLANLPQDVADSRLAEITGDGIEKVHFGWWGGTKPGEPHYFRVQGPAFLIELVNIQSDPAGNPANHIHTIWRSMRNDFGIKEPAAQPLGSR